jgi:hypothetical protein
LSTCISTAYTSVDKGCGKAVDNVDNPWGNRRNAAFFTPFSVDNPVDTVDE